MDDKSPVYQELNKAWKSTCKVLFGEEIGELKEYEEWLKEYNVPLRVEKSVVSSKNVHLAITEYCKNAKYVGFDEINFFKKFEPLNINEIKDIDTIIEAIQDRIYYTGEVILGDSKFVEGSSNIVDSSSVYISSLIYNSQTIAYSNFLRNCKYAFGIYSGAFSDFLVHGSVSRESQRMFEYYWVNYSSDVYYSVNLENCNNCLFCFNLRNKRNAIGNLELSTDKYNSLKKKIVSEIINDLKSKKRVPSLLELISEFPKEKLEVEIPEETFNLEPVEKAFNNVSKVILKRELGALENYRKYLFRHVPKMLTLEETSSKRELITSEWVLHLPVPKNRLISPTESNVLKDNPIKLDASEIEKLSLNNISSLSKIAFLCFSMITGNNKNVGKCPCYMNAVDCYDGFGYTESKCSAFSFWPRNSSYNFGSTMVHESSFCMNSYYSTNITRTFEVDSCTNCSDLYFSHNCESVQDSMFCFNVKNLRNAIGNAPLPVDSYRKIKDSIVQQIADELEKKKDLKWDIYNIGCGRKS